MLNNREISYIIWGVVFIIYLLTNSQNRKTINGFLCSLCNIKIMLVYVLLCLYTISIILLLARYGIWSYYLIKDTIIWFVFSVYTYLFRYINKRETINLESIILDNIGVVVLMEYILNMYALPFWVELISVPLLFFAFIVKEYTDPNNTSYSKIRLFSLVILSGWVIFTVLFTIDSIWGDINNLCLKQEIITVLYPLLLTIMAIPYLYLVVLLSEYERLFVCISNVKRDHGQRYIRQIKWEIIKYANISHKRVKRLWKFYDLEGFGDIDSKLQIKDLVKSPKYKIGIRASCFLFNDIKQVIGRLSKIGLGELSEWRKMPYSDEYCSMSKYFSFGDTLTTPPNTIAIYITGGAEDINTVELCLNIYNQNDYKLAINTYKSFVQKTIQALYINMEIDIDTNLDNRTNFMKIIDDVHIYLNYEESGQMEIWKLTIRDKNTIKSESPTDC